MGPTSDRVLVWLGSLALAAVSGVVDWQAACTGPAVIDVAHCQVNLLTFSTGTADQFTA